MSDEAEKAAAAGKAHYSDQLPRKLIAEIEAISANADRMAPFSDDVTDKKDERSHKNSGCSET